MRQIAHTKRTGERIKRVMIYQSGKDVYLFLYEDAGDGPCNYDHCYQALSEAEAECLDSYGIRAEDWQPIPDPPAGCQHDWISPTVLELDADGNCTFVTSPIKVNGDFNGLFGDLLCLSHSDSATTESGESILLFEGLELVAFEPDCDDRGNPAFLVARGSVTASPADIVHHGSRWCLRIDADGVRRVAALEDV